MHLLLPYLPPVLPVDRVLSFYRFPTAQLCWTLDEAQNKEPAQLHLLLSYALYNFQRRAPAGFNPFDCLKAADTTNVQSLAVLGQAGFFAIAGCRDVSDEPAVCHCSAARDESKRDS